MVIKKILIIDDDNLVRKTIRKALENEGYRVSLAKNASDAIEKVKEAEFDLIISDIRMPGKDGVVAVREIRQFSDEKGCKDIPIIFITGYAEMGLELKAEELGEIVLKPFDLDHLLVTIREYL